MRQPGARRLLELRAGAALVVAAVAGAHNGALAAEHTEHEWRMEQASSWRTFRT